MEALYPCYNCHKTYPKEHLNRTKKRKWTGKKKRR